MSFWLKLSVYVICAYSLGLLILLYAYDPLPGPQRIVDSVIRVGSSSQQLGNAIWYDNWVPKSIVWNTIVQRTLLLLSIKYNIYIYIYIYLDLTQYRVPWTVVQSRSLGVFPIWFILCLPWRPSKTLLYPQSLHLWKSQLY